MTEAGGRADGDSNTITTIEYYEQFEQMEVCLSYD